LAFRPARPGTRKIRREIALKTLLRKWSAVAEQAKPDLPVRDDCSAARGIGFCAGERGRYGVTDHRKRAQSIRLSMRQRRHGVRQQ
jgi:hypothetical protein